MRPPATVASLDEPGRPEWRIDSHAWPKGCLTKSGMAGHEDSREAEWRPITALMKDSA